MPVFLVVLYIVLGCIVAAFICDEDDDPVAQGAVVLFWWIVVFFNFCFLLITLIRLGIEFVKDAHGC